jgi:acyl-[acyl-carrier-protein]-phospholipid O-acyltransferase/long-chain-fatty-acid--[acyl-carrier-protein] ligase
MLNAIIHKLFRTEVVGENPAQPSEVGNIYIANHISFWDPVLITGLLPSDVCFVVNTQIAAKYAWALKGKNYVPIDQFNPYSIRKLVQLVRQGTSICIFPEGRISVTGALMKMYDGTGFLALRTGAKIIPLWFEGLQYAKWNYLQGKMPQRRFPKVKAQWGAPFGITRQDGETGRQAKARAARIIYDALANLGFAARAKRDVNLFDELVETASRAEAQVILDDFQNTLTYKQLLQRVMGLSFALERHLTDERVGILLPTSLAHIVTLFACFRLGVTPAILNFSMGADTIQSNCETAELRTIVTAKAFIERAGLQTVIDQLSPHYTILYLEDVREEIGLADKLKVLTAPRKAQPARSRRGHAVILFTSGSEARPKGVELSHDALFANVTQASITIDLTMQDRMLNAMPMFHSFGLTVGTLFPILKNIPLVVYPSPLHYKVIPEMIYDKNCTVFFGTNTFLKGYARMAHPYDFQSVRYVVAGAEKLQDDVRDVYMKRFGIRVFEGYGTTETAPAVCINVPMFLKWGSVGRLFPGMKARVEPVEGIAEGGKLILNGPNLMNGYWLYGRGFASLEPNAHGERWYDTGDIVAIDEEGYVHIKSRLKRFAKIGGEMVSLPLVEEIVKALNAENQVAAVSVPDVKKGERIVLYATQPITTKEIQQELVRQQKTALHLPSEIFIIDAIPVLGSGKTDYVSLTNRKGEF